MPPRRAVELRVGGQTYRVVATDDDQHVQHLAALVDRKYLEVVPPRGVTPQQAIFLTAMALAEDARVLAEEARVLAEEAKEQRERAERLEVERDRSTRVATRAREAVARLLQKVESVLGATAAGASPDAARSAAPAEDSRDVRQSLPISTSHPDLRQAGPRSGARASAPPANQTAPTDTAEAGDSVDLYELLNPSRDVRPSLPHEQPAPAVRTPVPADGRGGNLRLLRQSASWGPGAPSKSGPDDESR